MTVTVISKSGLLDHGNKTKEAAVEYRSQISSVRRKIEAKVTGQEANAIKAFIAKLNSLSQTLHDSYPLTLELYSEAVLKYEAGLTAAGFSSEVVKTKAADIQSIKTWLGETKSKEFLEKSEDLDAAIQVASKALALEPGAVEFTRDAGARAHSIAMNLAKHGDERQTTHDELENNLKQFISGLTVVSERLVGVKATLDNARFISSFSLNTAMDLISKGYLNEQNMDFLDSIQNEGDAKVLKVILGEHGYSAPTGFFTALGSVDTTKVSHAMMDIVYNRVNKEFSNVEKDKSPAMENLRTYIQAIANQDQEKAKTYFENLVLAGDRYAGTIVTVARGLVPELPDSSKSEETFRKYDQEWMATHPQLEEFNAKLKQAGVLTSLFESLYAIGVGKRTTIYKHSGHSFPVDKSIVLDELIYKKNGSFDFKITEKLGIQTKREKNATTSFYNTSEEVRNHALLDNINELKEKRKKEALKFVADLTQIAVGRFIPGSGKILDLISAGVKVDDTLSTHLDFVDKAGKASFTSLYKKVVGKKVSNSSKIFSHLEKFGKLEDDLAKDEEKLLSSIFDTGGRGLFGSGENDFLKYDLTYDLQANMKIDDMEKNGLKSYIYHNTNGNISVKKRALKQFEAVMEKEVNKKSNFNTPEDIGRKKNLTEETYKLFMNQGGEVRDISSSDLYTGLYKIEDKFLNEKQFSFQYKGYTDWDPFGLLSSDKRIGLEN